MRVLAIDPGFERIGIAILEKDLSGERLLHSECFKTSSKETFPKRLGAIGDYLEKVIKKYKPGALAIEKLFMTNNQKTVMQVSEARGVILYTAIRNDLGIFEYTPPQIKVAVTGYGRADKKMVDSMVQKLLKLEKKITSDDEMDAVAIGLTFFAIEKLTLNKKN